MRCQGERRKDAIRAVLGTQMLGSEVHALCHEPFLRRWARIDARERHLAIVADVDFDGQRAADATVEVEEDRDALLVEREILARSWSEG